MKPYKIGIDLGGTKTEVIILDPGDNEFYRKRVPTKDKDDYQKILLFVHNIILETIDKIPQKANCTIGVGIPGSINTETQLVQNANGPPGRYRRGQSGPWLFSMSCWSLEEEPPFEAAREAPCSVHETTQ